MKYQDDSHPACSTPNPPWFCGDSTPAANIDSSIFLLIGIIIAVLIAKYKFKIR